MAEENTYKEPGDIKEGYISTSDLTSGGSAYDSNELRAVYETLAPMAGDYMNAQAEQIGQAQQSMGPLAANTMGATTSGLGNYTYNRLMRPQVDTMKDELLVKGYANQLNRLLSDALNKARNRYNNSKSGGGGSDDDDDPDNKGTTGTTKVDDVEDEEKKEDDNKSGDKKSSEKKVDTVSTLPSTAKDDEENVGTATVNGQTRIVTKQSDGKYRISGVGSWRAGSKEWDDAKKKFNVQLNQSDDFWGRILSYF